MHKTFQKLFLSCLIIAMIPTLTNLAFSRQLINHIREETIIANTKRLQIVSEKIELSLRDIRLFTIKMATDDNVRKLGQPGYLPNNSNLVSAMIDLQSSLNRQEEARALLHDLVVYSKSSGVSVSPTNGYTEFSRYYGRFFEVDGISYTDFEQRLLSDQALNLFSYSASINYLEGNTWRSQRALVFSQRFPLSGRKRGEILATVSEEKLAKLIYSELAASNADIIIAQPDGQIIFSFSDKGESLNLLDEYDFKLSGDLNNEVITTDETRYLITAFKSPIEQWYYYSFVDYDELTNTTHRNNLINWIMLYSNIILIIIASILFARKNSAPVKKLVDIIQSSSYQGAEAGQYTDEYQLITNHLGKLIESHSELKSWLDEQKQSLSQVFFARLFAGKITTSGMLKRYEKYLDLDLSNTQLLLLAIRIDIHPGDDTDDKLEQLARVMITQYFRESKNQLYSREPMIFEQDFNRFCVLLPFNKDLSKTEIMSEAEHQAQELLKQTSKELGVHVVFAAASTTDDWLDLPEVFLHTMAALQQYIENPGIIRWYDQICELPEYSVYYSVQHESQLMLMAKSGESHNLKVLLDKIYEENFVKRNLPEIMLNSLGMSIWNTTWRLLAELRHLTDWDYQEYIKKQHQANEQSSPQLLFVSAGDVLREICKIVSDTQQTQTDTLITSIDKYIEEKYRDPQLSLSSIAHKFELSEAYISRRYKEQTNENLSTIIEKKRIDKACFLLKEGITLESISQQVGYNSVTVFRNAFKRVTGTTPSTYRKIN